MAEKMKVEYVGRMSALDLKANDIIVLESQASLRGDEVAGLREVIRKQFPEHIVLILDRGLKLGVVRKEAIGGVGGASE